MSSTPDDTTTPASQFTEDTLKMLCLQLAQADSEREVIDLLTDLGVWDDEQFWRDYGDDEGNFSDVGNQQSSAFDALAEKLVNASDAVLLWAAKAAGINPEDRTNAPSSPKDASERFFGIEGGDLTTLSSEERSKLARRIALVASGEKGRGATPCYSIIDRGEAQHPDDFPKTFLSLNGGNKLRIPFVSGKFNMGGTGALPFCGEKNVQLIISRRAPELVDDTETNPWGFTVVRRFDPSEIESDTPTRNPVYRYFVVKGGEVPRFVADELSLAPSDESHPRQCAAPMSHGTFIKLYDYQTPSSTNLILDPHYRLAPRLPAPALPVRLYETRGFSGNTLQATLAGLEVRLHDDRNQNIEPGFPTGSTITIGESSFGVRVFALKNSPNRNRNVEKYRQADDGVILTLNGQTHGGFDERFFTRQNVGMGLLKDSLVVLVDCDGMAADDRQKLFMNSRDRLRETDFRDELERRLERLLANHDGLDDLRERRQEEELQQSIEEDGVVTNALADLIGESPSLASVFTSGETLDSPDEEPDEDGKNDEGDDSPPYEGRRFPTKFDVVERHEHRLVPKNVTQYSIQFETDAVNDYFERDAKPGRLTLASDDGPVPDYDVSLWNGTAYVTIESDVGSREGPRTVGSTRSFEVTVTDAANAADPFVERFVVEWGEPRESSPSGGESGDENGSSGPSSPKGLSIPEPVVVSEDEWESSQFPFDENEAMFVVWGGKKHGYRFYVNGDNRHLVRYLDNESEAGQAEVDRARFKYGLQLMGLATLCDLAERQGVNDGLAQNFQTPDGEPDIEDQINDQARSLARVLLPTIAQLSKLDGEQ
ncbi:hypothetical protein [Halogranum rubrum]|uniref:Uncharacterized protein n=1 Tax=Halogranum salarium B-1 TaxID=1210908 RepID=J2ZAV6_9EURY|nr:hypothetical protein [Halogranum salarium]EJN57785.1 hypothetical protein HSB1_38700 [Halogranum salarium B-1]